MIKMNRTTEYGLVALRHIARKNATDPRGVTSAREIADYYGLPFEITAKTLQRLKDYDLIQSEQGARGGYSLKRPLSEVTLAEFLRLMEGSHAVVTCTSTSSPAAEGGKKKSCGCEYLPRCEIRGLMTNLNSRVTDFLAGIRLSEIVNGLPEIELAIEQPKEMHP